MLMAIDQSCCQHWSGKPLFGVGNGNWKNSKLVKVIARCLAMSGAHAALTSNFRHYHRQSRERI